MGLVAVLDHDAGMRHALFPELAALAFGALTQPAGKWARRPWALVVSPAVAGLIGVLVNRRFGLSPISVALTVAGALVTLSLLRSSIAPAISAGLLALFLDIKDPRYPVWILVDGLLLAAILAWHKSGLVDATSLAADHLEDHALSRRLRIGAPVVTFAALITALARFTGASSLLFPPLLVITYESFEDPSCRWLSHPLPVVVLCVVSSSLGVAAALIFGMSFLAVAATVGLALAAQSVMKAFIPPAIAVGLIPFLLAKPSWRYPACVVCGLCCASLYYHAMKAGSRVEEPWKTMP